MGHVDKRSITLSPELATAVDDAVAAGEYASASEVIRAGLRLLEDQDTRLGALRAALVAGEESGVPEEFDFDAFIAAKKS